MTFVAYHAGQESTNHSQVVAALCRPGALGSVHSEPVRSLSALLKLPLSAADGALITVFAGRTGASDIATFVAQCDSARLVSRVVLVAQSVAQLEPWTAFLGKPFCRDVIVESLEPAGPLLSAHVHDSDQTPCSVLALRSIGPRWGTTASAVLGVCIGSAFRVSTGSAIGRTLDAHRTSLNRRLWADGIRSLSVVVDAARVLVAWLRSSHCNMRPHEAIRSTGIRDPRAVRRVLRLLADEPLAEAGDHDAPPRILRRLDEHVRHHRAVATLKATLTVSGARGRGLAAPTQNTSNGP